MADWGTRDPVSAADKIRRDWDSQARAYNAAMADRPSMRGGTPWDRPMRATQFAALAPEDKIAMLDSADYFSPENPAPGYTKAMHEAYRYPVEVFTRPRDTAIRASQEAWSGNYQDALGLLARAPVSVAVPYAAAGREGDADDWREGARRLGISEANVAALDIGTDPLTYVGYPPFKAGAAKVMGRFPARAMDAADNIRSLSKEIEQLRRRGARMYHPDIPGGSAEIMRRVNQAADAGNYGELLGLMR
jgi:hypothetical protein